MKYSIYIIHFLLHKSTPSPLFRLFINMLLQIITQYSIAPAGAGPGCAWLAAAHKNQIFFDILPVLDQDRECDRLRKRPLQLPVIRQLQRPPVKLCFCHSVSGLTSVRPICCFCFFFCGLQAVLQVRSLRFQGRRTVLPEEPRLRSCLSSC